MTTARDAVTVLLRALNQPTNPTRVTITYDKIEAEYLLRQANGDPIPDGSRLMRQTTVIPMDLDLPAITRR